MTSVRRDVRGSYNIDISPTYDVPRRYRTYVRVLYLPLSPVNISGLLLSTDQSNSDHQVNSSGAAVAEDRVMPSSPEDLLVLKQSSCFSCDLIRP